MSENTKGVWTAHPYNSMMGSLISCGDISKGETIAIVCAQKDAEEGKAYARLIAAAPELLEFVKSQRSKMTCICKLNEIVKMLGADTECTVCVMDALIAKATGSATHTAIGDSKKIGEIGQ